MARWWQDGRYYQIAALGTLLALNLAWVDFGAGPWGALLAISGALSAQALCTYLWRLPVFDPRSALITGLSLSLLLRTDEIALYAAAGALAILSKFVLRLDGKHLWNPATFAIVALRYGTGEVWVSPGQWGAALWFVALLAILAAVVLQRSRRVDTAFFFLAAHAALLAWRAIWLGDPWTIPLHQLESGSLLLFAFFMVTDPRTTVRPRWAQMVVVFIVALVEMALRLAEVVYAPIYALFLVGPAALFIESLLEEKPQRSSSASTSPAVA